MRRKLIEIFQQRKADQKKNQHNSHEPTNSVAGIVENLLNKHIEKWQNPGSVCRLLIPGDPDMSNIAHSRKR
jgi:hypothetical protein